MTAPLYPRCSADLCVRCRKKLDPGDRVTIVHIVEKVMRNPTNPLQMGAMLSGEFEMSHVDCADTSLEGRLITR